MTTGGGLVGGDAAASLRPIDRLLGAGVLLVLVVFGVGLSVGRGGDDGGLPPPTTLASEPVEQVLGPGPWVEEAGRWGAVDGEVRVVAPAGPLEPSLLLQDTGWVDGTVRTTFADVVAQAGLVFRARGPDDLWVLLPAPAFATWAVERHLGGEVVATLPVGLRPVSDGTTVEVVLSGTTAAVRIGEEQPVVLDLVGTGVAADGTPEATHVGFFADAQRRDAGRWSSFEAIPA